TLASGPTPVLLLSLVAGLAAQRAVAEVTGASPDLRWPNDLLLNEKKFGGILVEMASEAARIRHVVAGIGINVNHAVFPPDLSALATSLRIETGRPWPRRDLVIALLQSLDREYKVFPGGEADI